MITALAIIFTIFIIVFFHELGHFTFAKLFGVRVEKFSIGFPPVIFKTKKGDTEYSIGLTPLGGFVKMAGMIDENMDQATITGAPDEFMSKNFIQKFFILSGGVIFNLITAAIIFTGVFWTSGAERLSGTTIAQVDTAGTGFRLGFKPGDRIVAINDIPVKDWTDISELFLKELGPELSFQVERNGKMIQMAFNETLFKQKEAEYLGLIPLIKPKIGRVLAGYPADKSGIKPGDEIIGFNGGAITSWGQLTDSISKYPETPVDLTLLRGTDTLQVAVVPRAVDIVRENMPTQSVGRIGVTFYMEQVSYPLSVSLNKGVQEVGHQIVLNIKGFYWLFSGKKNARDMVGGPVKIAQMAGQAAEIGLGALFRFIGMLSVILAIINFLPIPALDGGHIVVVSIEAIRRKPLSDKTKVVIQQVGMVILLLLMVFAIFNDITH